MTRRVGRTQTRPRLRRRVRAQPPRRGGTPSRTLLPARCRGGRPATTGRYPPEVSAAAFPEPPPPSAALPLVPRSGMSEAGRLAWVPPVRTRHRGPRRRRCPLRHPAMPPVGGRKGPTVPGSPGTRSSPPQRRPLRTDRRRALSRRCPATRGKRLAAPRRCPVRPPVAALSRRPFLRKLWAREWTRPLPAVPRRRPRQGCRGRHGQRTSASRTRHPGGGASRAYGVGPPGGRMRGWPARMAPVPF